MFRTSFVDVGHIWLLVMTSYTSKDLGHLGIVSAVCREIHLVEIIDEIVGVDPRQKVTCGEAVLAMILNCLGFVNRPLYLFTEYMKTKPVEILIRNDLTSEDINEYTIGRALDKLFKAGLEPVFIQIAAKAYKHLGYGFDDSFFHSDTTSMSFHGEYKHEEGDIDAVPIEITHGYSKDHRPDLKQVVISLIVSKGLPIFIQTLSGDTSDKTHFKELVLEYGKSLEEIWKNRIWIWDSAFYTKKNVEDVGESFKWISRVPETISAAKKLLISSDVKSMTKTEMKGYCLLGTMVTYGGVLQRWIVVYSEKAYKRQVKTVEKRIQKEKEKAETALWHLSNKDFKCKEDGITSLRDAEKKWKYHKVNDNIIIEIKNKKKDGGQGRPKKGEVLDRFYRIKATLVEDQEAIQKLMLTRGKFIIATNELNEKDITDEKALKAYKEQQYAERGFRFLKDPLFFAQSIFLKNERRIAAMVMVMGLALLVYAIAEKKLRKALKEGNETVPDQKKRPTSRPTIRRTFQVFEGITVLYDEKGRMIDVMNIEDIHRKVVSLLGEKCEGIYCNGA